MPPSSASLPVGRSRQPSSEALALGLPQDPDLESIIRAYIADFLPG